MENSCFSGRFLLSCAILLATLAAFVTPVRAGDNEAIIAGTKKYLAANSYPSDMKIAVEKVAGDYARVLASPKDGKMDAATVFLKREHGAWKGLTLGTGWDPADLDKLHIPKSLQP